MEPHKPNPTSRKIEVDISGILLGPENVRTSEISGQGLFQEDFSNQADPSIEPHVIRLGRSGWMNFNFIAVCCLIAVFSTIFIRHDFEHSRRNAHLPADASDLKPDFHSITSQSLLQPSRLASAVQLDSRINSPDQVFHGSPKLGSQTRQDFPATSESPTSMLSNPAGFADRTSSTGTSRSVSSESGPAGGVSRATSSAPGRSSSAEAASGSRSATGRTIRRSSRSTISARKGISSRRQSLRNTATRSAFQSTTHHGNTVKVGVHQSSILQAKAATHGDLMSMHSLGGGARAGQIPAATNSMRMEGGLLAQPGIGAGLGGLGGGGGAHRGGGRVAK